MRAWLWLPLVGMLACGENDKGPEGRSGGAASGASAGQVGTAGENNAGKSTGGSSNAGSANAEAGDEGGGTTGQGGSGNGGAGTSANGGEPASGGAPSGCLFNDTFTGSALDPCWQELNGTPQNPLIGMVVANGALHLTTNGNQNGVWYQGSTKSLVYQLVSASHFKVTSTVRPRKATSPSDLPTKDLHVGGLMVRSPASQGGATENYILLMVGHSENNNGVVHQGVELKSTVSGCSDWNEPDWGGSAMDRDAELRICRLGAEFRHYKRLPGAGAWTPATPPSGCAGNTVAGDVLTRGDLPETLQVGMALNFSSPSDLDVAFDAIELVVLSESATAADCSND